MPLIPLTTHVAPFDPSWRDAVLRELAEFRRRDGIDVRKIRESGGSVMLLPAVARSVADRGVPADIAAFEYLKCIAGRSKDLGNEYQRIVWTTLNFEGNASSLTQRRDMLRGSRKESAFLEYERAAFENYAGQLVWRRSSPCEDSTSERDNNAWANALLTSSYDQDAIDFLMLALSKLHRSRTEDETREYARRLVEALPVGRQWLAEQMDVKDAIDASDRLFVLAEWYAILRGAVLHPTEVNDQLARIYGVSEASLRRRDFRDRPPIVAKTAMWLEQSRSWDLVVPLFYDEARASRNDSDELPADLWALSGTERFID